MTAAKIAITLPQAQVAHIKRIVRDGRAESVSGYISRTLAEQERHESLHGLVADLIAQHGEPTPPLRFVPAGGARLPLELSRPRAS